MATATHVPEIDSARIAVWRRRSDRLALVLAISIAVYTVGLIISALGFEVEGVEISGWDRLALLSGTAAPVLFLPTAAAVVLVLGLRSLFRWPAEVKNGSAIATLVVVVPLCAWTVTASLFGLLRATLGNNSGTVGSALAFDQVLDGTEQAGTVIAFLGLASVAAVVGVAATIGLVSLSSRRQEPPQPL